MKKKLNKFKETVRKKYTVSPFTTKENLAIQIIQDLERELPKYGITVGKQKDETEALDLEEGSSIKRKFKVLNEDYAKILESHFSYIYASDEKALELSELNSSEYTIILRLKFDYAEHNIKEKVVIKPNGFSLMSMMEWSE